MTLTFLLPPRPCRACANCSFSSALTRGESRVAWLNSCAKAISATSTSASAARRLPHAALCRSPRFAGFPVFLVCFIPLTLSRISFAGSVGETRRVPRIHTCYCTGEGNPGIRNSLKTQALIGGWELPGGPVCPMPGGAGHFVSRSEKHDFGLSEGVTWLGLVGA